MNKELTDKAQETLYKVYDKGLRAEICGDGEAQQVINTTLDAVEDIIDKHTGYLDDKTLEAINKLR